MLKDMQIGLVVFAIISLIRNFLSLFVDEGGGGFVLRDVAVEGLSLRKDSFRVLRCC